MFHGDANSRASTSDVTFDGRDTSTGHCRPMVVDSDLVTAKCDDRPGMVESTRRDLRHLASRLLTMKTIPAMALPPFGILDSLIR